MKYTIIIYGALLAAAATLARPIADFDEHRHFCYRVGEPCSEARRSLDELSTIHKRAALASAEAMAIAEAKHHRFCWIIGEPCSEAKLKRDATSEAITSALNDPEAIDSYCHRADQPCAKLKRAAQAVAKAMTFSEILPEPEYVNTTSHHFCYGSGQPCALARRSALALAEALPVAASNRHFCYRIGEPCSEAKRDALRAAEFEADTKRNSCWPPQKTCSAARRDVEYDVQAAQEYCDSVAGPCYAKKRFAAAVADAIADLPVKARGPQSKVEQALQERCYTEDGICHLSERAVEEVGILLAAF